MKLISITYNSAAVASFSGDALAGLLKQSRNNNTSLGITGLLLYKDGEFMQVLEGEQLSVERLYSRIEKDPRHLNCSQLRWEVITQRRFPDWSMSFTTFGMSTFETLPATVNSLTNL